MILYHGSGVIVDKPSVDRGRSDVDFGVGFYLTEDNYMAKKWASNKVISIVNQYDADLTKLNIKRFEADEEWLDYVSYNRLQQGEKLFSDSAFDVIIGPTADDRLFETLDLYSDGIISKKDTLKIINCMNYSNQVVFKSNSAIEKGLKYIGSKQLAGLEKQDAYKQMIEDRKLASRRAHELLRRR